MPNVTVRIDDERLLRKVRVIAARRGLSLSALVREMFRQLAGADDAWEEARRRALASLERGVRAGGRPLAREEAHDDRSSR